MRTHIEINKAALINNFYFLKSLVYSETKIISVVKGNAYGHGLKEVVSILDKHTDYFAVSNIDELKELRRISSKPTLILYSVGDDELNDVIDINGILCINNLRQLIIVNQIGQSLKKRITIHISIDANLGREGFLPKVIKENIDLIKRLEFIDIEAVYGHFSDLEDTNNLSHAKKQIEVFNKVLKIFSQKGFNIKNHIQATSGVLAFGQDTLGTKQDFIRLGIGLYGLWPSKKLMDNHKLFDKKLIPVLAWKTIILDIKTLEENSPVGYGQTFITKRKTTIAIIPVGYADGFDRRFSNNGYVLVKGEKCNILGRVSMNLIVVDITDIVLKNIDINVGDQIILIGDQKNSLVEVDDLAAKIQTINYEIVTRINPLVPRIIT